MKELRQEAEIRCKNSQNNLVLCKNNKGHDICPCGGGMWRRYHKNRYTWPTTIEAIEPH